MEITTTLFTVGEKVRPIGGTGAYTVQAIELVPVLTLTRRNEHPFTALAADYEPLPQLDEQEAWLEAAALIGGLIHQMGTQYAASEPGGRKIRHECYVLLGGSGVKVTDEVRARVAALVDRMLTHCRAPF